MSLPRHDLLRFVASRAESLHCKDNQGCSEPKMILLLVAKLVNLGREGNVDLS